MRSSATVTRSTRSRFEQFAQEARTPGGWADEGRFQKLLVHALGLWRGDAYQGYRYTNFGAAEGERLDEPTRAAEDLVGRQTRQR